MPVESKVSDAYGKLMESTKELFILQSMGSIVYWDMETKMPSRGVNLRSQQMALLEKISHRMLTDPEKGKLINEIIDHPNYGSLGEVEKRNVFLTKKAYDEATKLPEELVVETARQQALTVNVWKKAKAAKDYGMFRPDLEKLFDLKKRAAEILMDVKGTSTPYDALIDLFEPGMTADMIDKVFTGMRKGLIEIIDKCRDSESQPDTSFMDRGISVEAQRNIAEALTDLIGYKTKGPEAGGRIDETEHPFTTGYYDDVRITTHYHEERFASSVFSVLHEGGHALYEQGLPGEWMYQPVGTASSMGIHESQSRFVENMIGRSTQFWSHFLPELKKLTGDALSDVDLAEFVWAINRVHPSKIRVEADEITYGLHIIIRFEMERDLLAGRITFDELPQAWNEKYREYLGVEVQHDSEGVMQDTHWAGGSYGYFPSYALGNIYGGMMLDKMKADLPDMMEKIAAGSFKEVGGWLVENVHRHGDLHDPADLIKKITGRNLTYTPFLKYLEDKFSQLYGF